MGDGLHTRATRSCIASTPFASECRDGLGNEAVVVTDGEQGCAIDAREFVGTVPAVPTDVLDTTGAGDAFLGGLLAGRTAGLGWAECGEVANALGGVCAGRLGAFPTDPGGALEAVLRRCVRYADVLRALAGPGRSSG